ncbi:transcriptional regulator with XRE-family HTH domain [Streptacidiphilus sp. BW17]|uniref:helix-turn-helix domain-containing protein n=1 Tax=unclassified Streptacidiphilus TaxID=2643834 RepID=UPI0035140EBB
MSSGSAPPTLSVSDAAALRLKEARTRRGWTTKQLAAACHEAGATKLTAPALSNIETGRRGADGFRRRELSIDEVVVLAVVLDIAPVHLLGLPDSAEPGTKLQLTPELAVSDPELLMEWFCGQRALPESDSRQFYSATLQRMPANDGQQAIADLTRSVLQDRAAALAESFNSEMAATLEKINAAVQSGASPEELAALLRPGETSAK